MNGIRAGLFAIGIASFGGAAEKEATVSEFIRFDKDDDQLQTAIVRYASEDHQATVDLVSIIHIGDSSYYVAINELLKNYDTVFFEMVGGESQEFENPREKENQKYKFAQSRMGETIRFLGLETQRDWVNYDLENFVHADLNWKEIYELMDARSQSLTSTFKKMDQLNKNKGANLMRSAYFGTLTGGDRTAIKRGMAKHLSDTERIISKLEGEGGTVVVGERNKAVMQKVVPALNPPDNQTGEPPRLAILYGGAHMPDFEMRLAEIGYQKQSTKWMSAWAITPQKRKAADETPLDKYLKSLSSGDPEKIKAARKALDEAAESETSQQQ